MDVIRCLSVSLRPKKCEGVEIFSYQISVYFYVILSAELRDMNLHWNLDSRFIFIYEIYACVYTYKRALFNISDLLSRIQKCWLCVARLYGYEDVNKKRVSYNLSWVCKWYRPCRMDGEALGRTANNLCCTYFARDFRYVALLVVKTYVPANNNGLWIKQNPNRLNATSLLGWWCMCAPKYEAWFWPIESRNEAK